jgi:CRP/FNR family transcriptional regulator
METLLTNPVIAPMLQTAVLRTYEKGQTILYPDDQPTHLFLIKKGAVTMYDIDDQGNQKVIHIFGPPALFPMVSFINNTAEAAWFYGALVQTEVYLVPYQELKTRLENVDGVAAYNLLLRQLLAEVHELVVRITNGTKTNSLGKLVTALKFLAVHHSRPLAAGWCRIVFPASHQLLADMSGLARETVTLSMKQLQQYRAIRNGSPLRLDIHLERLGKIAQ